MDDGDFSIRAAAPGDLPALVCIYRTAIEHVGPRGYSRAQVAAWAAFADERDAFCAWIDGADTVVAVGAHGWPLGFAGLAPPARIASLFVAPVAMRRARGARRRRGDRARLRVLPGGVPASRVQGCGDRALPASRRRVRPLRDAPRPRQ